jgi:hypothetical protein
VNVDVAIHHPGQVRWPRADALGWIVMLREMNPACVCQRTDDIFQER